MSDLSENRQALFDWVGSERPDMLDNLRQLLDTPEDNLSSHLSAIKKAIEWMAAAAFEAGRFFQHVNPTCGLGVVMPGDWNRIVAALAAYHEGNTLPKQE